MVRLLTRKTRRSNRSSTRRGGAAFAPGAPVKAPQTCVSLLKRLLPGEDDFERMQENNVTVTEDKTYPQFVDYNVGTVFAMPESECAFHKSLFERILRHRVSSMDLEGCSVFSADNVFFDEKQNLVVVNQR